MKLSEAIERMTKMLEKHGDIPVCFDCPNCETSFEPGKVESVAVHVKGGKKVKP